MKFPDRYIYFYIFFLLAGSFTFAQSEFKIPDPPSKIYPVNDYAGVLTSDQLQSLNQKLIAYSDSTSTEIIVSLVKTLDGNDINYVATKWGEKWKIGQREKNNGIVLLIAVQDRKLAIQNGRGTEDAMTDMVSGIIINQYMKPYLQKNNYYGAVNSGTDQIINALQGKFKGNPKSQSNTDDDFSGLIVAVMIFFFILLLITASKNRSKDTYYDRKGKRKKDDDDFWGGFGGFGGFGGGGFGGGSSGGGFGGFGGGGSFGGGGASGGW